MITFFRTRTCERSRAIQDALEELCIAHKTMLLDSPEELPDDLAGGLPVLVDGSEVVHGSEAILAHLEYLERFKALWDKFQTDAFIVMTKAI